MNSITGSAVRPFRVVEPPVIQTKFLRLRQPVLLGHRIDGWRVCWLGGWDRGRIFFVVMVWRRSPAKAELPPDC